MTYLAMDILKTYRAFIIGISLIMIYAFIADSKRRMNVNTKKVLLIAVAGCIMVPYFILYVQSESINSRKFGSYHSIMIIIMSFVFYLVYYYVGEAKLKLVYKIAAIMNVTFNVSNYVSFFYLNVHVQYNNISNLFYFKDLELLIDSKYVFVRNGSN